MGILYVLKGQQAAAGTDWLGFFTAIGAIIAALAAVIALVIDGHRRRRQLGIDNMWRLVERWDQPLLRSVRATAATSLLKTGRNQQELSPEAREVLNIFELLAYLVITSKTLPVRDAWVNFSSHAIFWWNACLPAVEIWRAGDPTAYEELAKLSEAFRTYEEVDRGLPPFQPTEEDIRAFLRGEASLDEGRRELRVSWPGRRPGR